MPLKNLLSDGHIWNPSPIIFSSDKEGSANAEQRKIFSSRKNSNLFRSLPMFHWGIRSTDTTTTTTTTTTRYLLQKLLLNLVLRHQEVSFFPLGREKKKKNHIKLEGSGLAHNVIAHHDFLRSLAQKKKEVLDHHLPNPKVYT
jgi:hypothetical protein